MKIITIIFLIFFMSAFQISYAGQKHKFLDSSHKHSSVQKSRGFVHLTIEEIKKEKDQLHLKVEIIPQKDMPSGQVLWQLPPEAVVIEGELEQDLRLTAHSIVHKEIVIDTTNLKDKAQIFFFAFQLQNGERYGASGSYTFKRAASSEFKASGKTQPQKIHGKKIIQ